MNWKHPLLPEATRALLTKVGGAIGEERAPNPRDLAALLALLAPLPPGSIAQIASEIQQVGQLWWHGKPRLMDILRTRSPPGVLMASQPDAAWLLLFHYDGRVREAALDALPGPPPSAFFLAAIAFRLNDWAYQVRAAAHRAARRLFPLAAPEVVAEAGMALLDREFHWARWKGEAAALYEPLGREDVVAPIVEAFKRPGKGPEARRFRYLLRLPQYESAIPDLVRTAVNPAVRAVAYAALLKRRVEWAVGYTIQWTDRIYNEGRRVQKMEGRPFSHDIPQGELIDMGLADRSPVVRRLAADAFVASPVAPSDPPALLARMLVDRSPAVQMRADYLVRHGLVGPNKKAGG